MPLAELLSMSMQSTGYTSYLLLAATLPPMMYVMLKKKRGNFFQRLMLRIVQKRMMKKGRGRKFGLKDVFAILSLLCLVLFFVFATGGTATGLAIPMALGFLGFLIAWAIAAKKKK